MLPKFFRKGIALLLTVTMVLSLNTIPVNAQNTADKAAEVSSEATETILVETGKCGDNLEYSIVSCLDGDYDYELTISGSGPMYDYETEYDYYYMDEITTAPWRPFFNKNVKLIIENGITHIGNNAFNACRGFDRALEIPMSVKSIGEYAYARSSFSGELVLNEGLKSIGYAAFMGDEISGTIIIPSTLEFFGMEVFSDNSGITQIDNRSSCEIELYDIDNEEVYWVDEKGNVVDPIVKGVATKVNGTSNVGKCGRNLTYEITKSNSSDYDYNLHISGTGEMYAYTGSLHNTAPWKKYEKSRIKLTFDEGITGIYGHPFSHCNLVGNLNLPNSLTEIGGQGFNGMTNLTGELILPANLTVWNSQHCRPFGNCTGFTKITNLSNNDFELDYLDPDALWIDENGEYISRLNNSTATKVDTKGKIGKCGANVFFYLDENPDEDSDYILTISGNGAMYDYMNNNGTIPTWSKLDNKKIKLNINPGITRLGDYAFSYDGFVGDVIIPEGVEEIGFRTFTPCYLEGSYDWGISSEGSFDGTLELPKTIKHIEFGAFAEQTKLSGGLALYNGLEIIESAAFYNCMSLSGDLNIPKSVTGLGNNIFAGCSGFKGQITIPENVAQLENDIMISIQEAQSPAYNSLYTSKNNVDNKAVFERNIGEAKAAEADEAEESAPAAFSVVDNRNDKNVLLPQDSSWHWIDADKNEITEISSGRALKIKEDSYLIDFDGCGGKIQPSECLTALAGDKLSAVKYVDKGTTKFGTLPTARAKKQDFVGWFTEKEAGVQITAESDLEAVDVQTLYAHWVPNPDAEDPDDDDDSEEAPNPDDDKNQMNLNLVVKHKYNVSQYYTEFAGIKKYRVESPDGKIATVSSKGKLNAKKPGVVTITPLIKVGKEYKEIEGAKPLTVTILKPYVCKKCNASVNQTISIKNIVMDIPLEKYNISLEIPKKAKNAVYDAEAKSIRLTDKGKLSVKVLITTDQGTSVKYKCSVIISPNEN